GRQPRPAAHGPGLGVRRDRPAGGAGGGYRGLGAVGHHRHRGVRPAVAAELDPGHRGQRSRRGGDAAGRPVRHPQGAGRAAVGDAAGAAGLTGAAIPRIGWGERSEPQRDVAAVLGFAALTPTYATAGVGGSGTARRREAVTPAKAGAQCLALFRAQPAIVDSCTTQSKTLGPRLRGDDGSGETCRTSDSNSKATTSSSTSCSSCATSSTAAAPARPWW